MVRAGLLGQRGDSLSNKCAIGDGEQRGFVRIRPWARSTAVIGYRAST